jgi:hypothetical protein
MKFLVEHDKKNLVNLDSDEMNNDDHQFEEPDEKGNQSPIKKN